MKRARRALGRFVTKIKTAALAIAKFSLVIIALSAFAMALLVRKSFQLNDVLAKTADKLGITTESLAALSLAANITGVATTLFSKALETMAKNVADAANGIGEAKDALEALGLDAKQLSQQGLDKMFLKIAAAVKGIADQSQKILIFRNIFGRPGAGLLNTAKLTGQQFQEFAKFAAQAGLAISRVDAAAIETANDAVTKLKVAFQGLATVIAKTIAPFVTKIADAITGLLLAFDKDAIGKAIVSMFELGSIAVGEFIKLISSIPAKLASIGVAVIGLTRGILDALPLVDAPTEGLFSATSFNNAKRLLERMENIRDINAQMVNDVVDKILGSFKGPKGLPARDLIDDVLDKSQETAIKGFSARFLAVISGQAGFGSGATSPLLAVTGRVESKQLTVLESINGNMVALVDATKKNRGLA